MTAQQEIAPEATKVSSFWLMMGLNTGIEQDPQKLLTLQRNSQGARHGQAMFFTSITNSNQKSSNSVNPNIKLVIFQQFF
jgi:hypothetical protein